MKPKKCKHCKAKFMPERPLQYLCSPICAYEYQKVLKSKKIDKETKELKEKLLTHKDYIKLLQATFNTFIRLRDKDLGCISCGVPKCEEFHAGHYLPTTFQYHRFTETNVHKQCSRCNTHLRGNLTAYRINLIKKIGLDEVEYLENTRHMMLEITIPELKEKIIYYKKLIKNLQNKK